MKNFASMMKQAQELQGRMAEMQAEMERARVDGQSGGGLVVLTMNGKGDLVGVKIDPSLVKPEEAEILEDLIVAAHNDAKAKVERMLQEKMQSLTGGLPLTRPEAVLTTHGARCRKRRDRAPHPIAGAFAGSRPAFGAPCRAASRQEEGAAAGSARNGAHRST
jgi:DNA-binding YbaB/EbfC family protein